MPFLELFSLVVLQLSLPPVAVALVIALLVISLGIHEAAHGWVALQCGDTTARDLGRITLNPIPHIDPFMTIVLPLVLYLSGAPIFGGARPVPVNYYNLRHPLRDMALVALAGPGSNFLLAVLFLAAQKGLIAAEVWQEGRIGDVVLEYAVFFNLLLAAFNLLPIPPLDGSRVMTWLLPSGMRESYARLERFGIYLVIFLVFLFPPVRALLGKTIDVMHDAVEAIVSLGGAW